MSLNLLDIVKSQLGNAVASQASSYLGEKSENVTAAMGGILPTLLGSIIQKGADEKGASGIMDMITKGGFDGNGLSDLVGMFSGGKESTQLMDTGGGILSSLLGSKTSGVIDLISNFAGVKKSSSSSLLKMALPFLMNAIGGQVSKKGLNPAGLMNMLQSQGDHVKSAMPSGLSGISNLLGFSGLASGIQEGSKKVLAEANQAGQAAVDTGKSSMRWLLPALLVLGVIAGLLYFMRGDSGDNILTDAANTVIETAENAGEKVSDMAESALDATTEAARNALSSIEFAAGSVGEKLSGLLSSDEAITDNIRFNKLTFESGSTAIVGETLSEVDNLAAVLKAYPNVKLEIQGYTDNTGDAARNVALSEARANAVKARLVELGISEDALTTAGLGAANPVATNDTEEGRKQNRRIEVKVIR